MTQAELGERPVFIPENMSYPGSSLTLSKMPALLSEGVSTTGLIPYVQPFPIWLAMPKGDEQALAVIVAGEGIVLITDCGHVGLESLLARAEVVFDVPVVGVIGGLHYGDTDPTALQPEIQLVNELNPVVVALSPHDSGPAVLDAFAQAFPNTYTPIVVGQPIHLLKSATTP